MSFCAAYVGSIEANRTVKDELTAVINRRSARRRISVTDLVNPRQTFFARTHPEIQPSPDRLQRMMEGTGFHDVFGRAVSTEEFVEQHVEFRGIVGRIDIYEDAPVELKTTSSIPADPIAWRPSQVEQLAMYCAMVGRPRGYLLYYLRSEFGRPPALKAFDLDCGDLEPIGEEMERRRDLLRDALDTGRPDRLPRCEWFGRNCDYEALCGCQRAEPLVRVMDSGAVSLRENRSLAERLLDHSRAGPPRPRLTLHSLVWPRRAAYELIRGINGHDEESPGERMKSMQRRGFEEMLNDAVWYGFLGQVRRVRMAFGPISTWITFFRDTPTIQRVTFQREMVDRKRLSEAFPHYVDRLGFECALTGQERGRVIIYYSAIPADKFMVYDFWFRDLPAIRAEMERRLRLLEDGTPPQDLPPCRPPSWVQKICPFGTECRCSEE